MRVFQVSTNGVARIVGLNWVEWNRQNSGAKRQTVEPTIRGFLTVEILESEQLKTAVNADCNRRELNRRYAGKIDASNDVLRIQKRRVKTDDDGKRYVVKSVEMVPIPNRIFIVSTRSTVRVKRVKSDGASNVRRGLNWVKPTTLAERLKNEFQTIAGQKSKNGIQLGRCLLVALRLKFPANWRQTLTVAFLSRALKPNLNLDDRMRYIVRKVIVEQTGAHLSNGRIVKLAKTGQELTLLAKLVETKNEAKAKQLRFETTVDGTRGAAWEEIRGILGAKFFDALKIEPIEKAIELSGLSRAQCHRNLAKVRGRIIRP